MKHRLHHRRVLNVQSPRAGGTVSSRKEQETTEKSRPCDRLLAQASTDGTRTSGEASHVLGVWLFCGVALLAWVSGSSRSVTFSKPSKPVTLDHGETLAIEWKGSHPQGPR